MLPRKSSWGGGKFSLTKFISERLKPVAQVREHTGPSCSSGNALAPIGTVIDMNDDDDIVREFLAESHENLDRLDREVVELEKSPSDSAILASIFRTIHTIKGTSGFLAFDKLGAVTHVGENLLARLRDGQLLLNPERTTALLALVDVVRQMLAEIQTTETDGSAEHPELVANLTRLQQPETTPVAEPAPHPDSKQAAPMTESTTVPAESARTKEVRKSLDTKQRRVRHSTLPARTTFRTTPRIPASRSPALQTQSPRKRGHSKPAAKVSVWTWACSTS